MRASPRPWLVLPPAKEAIELTAAPKVAGVAHGVPVWRDWNTKIGNQGTKVRQPTAPATRHARAPARHSGFPRHSCQASHSPTVPTR